MNTQEKKSGLATAGMVLGIIGAVLAFIPLINNLAFVLGVLAIIFGGIALAKKANKGKAIAGLVLGILSIVITLLMQQALSDAFDEALSPTKTSPESSETKDEEADEKVFDGAAAYKKVKNGMTKSEVRKVAGVDPDNCTSSEDETFGKIETCSYGNMIKDDVSFSVTFSQGKVSSKSKFES